MGNDLVALFLAIVGFLGTILICGLPMWKVSAFVGANIITSQVFWEGLWMACVVQSTGHSQCKAYDSVLALPRDLQAARALVCASIAVSAMAIGLTVVGGRCTSFLRDDWPRKQSIGIAGGAVFVVAGLLCVVPVSWSAYNIIQGFYNPLATQDRRGELGASVYVGWASGALLIIGGGMLSCTYRTRTMAGHCRQIGGLALCLVGVIGVCVVCGLPMWRETSFVGANIITAQSVWDGLWMHCILQATGQMQCKKHTSAITMTTDIQAGRVLTLLSIILGLLGFTITLLGGGVVNCSGQPIQPIYTLTESNMSGTSSKAKAALLGGLLCILAGVLVLVSVSWSAAFTISAYNDPLVVAALRREVGSAIYIGWGSTLFLLLGGTLICLVCGAKRSPRDPSYRTYLSYGYNPSPALITPSITPYTRSEFSYDPGTLDRRMGNKIYSPGVEPRGRSQSTDPNWSDQSRTPFLGPQTNPAMLLHDAPIRNSVMPDKYYVAHAF